MKELYDDQAELQVIGAALSGDKLSESALELTADHFFIPDNQIAFSALKKMESENTPMTWQMLARELQIIGWDKHRSETTSANYTFQLGTALMLGKWKEVLKEKRRLRLATESAQGLIRSIEQGQDSQTASNRAIRQISDVFEESDKKDIFLVEMVTKGIERIDKLRKGEVLQAGIKPGFPTLDTWLRFCPEDLIVVAARSGIGKTAFTLQLVSHIAEIGHSVGVVSLEMSEDQLAVRMIAERAMVNMTALKSGSVDDESWSKIEAYKTSLSGIKAVFCDRPNMTFSKMRFLAKRWKRQYNIEILFIDYLQLLDLGESSRARHEEVAKISKGLKQLAKELQIPIVALAQLNREAAEGRPGMHQIRESGAIEQDADTAILLHQTISKEDESKNKHATVIPYDLIIDKNRQGRTGSIQFAFNKACQHFKEL